MTPDLTFVTETFRKFNLLIFSTGLPLPKICLTHARTFRGKLVYRRRISPLGSTTSDFELRISADYDAPEEDWEDVVIHEMIHLYIAFNGIKDSSSHGPVFRKMMNDINLKHGRNITVSTRTTKEQQDSDKRVRGHFLCIVKFSDGRLAVAPVAKSRVFQLWNEFGKFPNAVALKWVGSTDPWFNRFPRVIKTKLYLTSATELLPHLKGGLLLGRDGNTVRVVSQRCSPDELLP